MCKIKLFSLEEGGGVEYSNLVLFKTAVYMVDFKKISCAEHEYLNTPLLIKTGYFQNVPKI